MSSLPLCHAPAPDSPLSTLTAGWYWFVVSSHNVRDNSWTVRTQTAFVDIPTSTLNITRGGTGTGGITASPSMVSCPGGSTTQAVPCPEATYTTGTIVTLTAVPDAGSTFAGWVGACSGTAPWAILLNGARHVTAMFAKVPGSIETRYYHTDVIGSVRAITDEAGAVVIRHDYAPFGEDTQPLTGDPMRFAGKELDPETGMHYFAARYYRNTWGRFTSVDPVMGRRTNPQSFNRYAYALNNPLRFVDPTGLEAECITLDSGAYHCGFLDSTGVTASATYGFTGEAPYYEMGKVCTAGYKDGMIYAIYSCSSGDLSSIGSQGGAGGNSGRSARASTQVSSTPVSPAASTPATPVVVAAVASAPLSPPVQAVAVTVAVAVVAVKVVRDNWDSLVSTFDRMWSTAKDLVYRSNTSENDEVDRIADRYHLNDDQRDRLHRAISKKKLSLDDIEEIARQLEGTGKKWERTDPRW